MADFDREALVAAAEGAQSDKSGMMFWGLVIALPIIGLVAGMTFLSGEPKAPAPITLSETAAPELETVTVEAAQETLPAVAVWSADAEMTRYTTVRSAISACSTVMDSSLIYDSRRKFVDYNAPQFEKLRAIKQAEYKARAGERRAAATRANNKMLLQAVTGQASGEALSRMSEFTNLMQEMEDMSGQPYVHKTAPEVLIFFGGEPTLGLCSKLRSELPRGTHNIKFAAR